jgi:ketosteroid isomerase-like protein
MSSDADVSAIKKAAADMLEATNQPGRAGAEGYASFALPDAHWMPPDEPAIRGRAAIADFAAPFTEMKDFTMSWEHPEVRVAESRDIAYSVGTFSGSGRDDEGNLQEFKGKLLNIWHRQPDDSWRIAVAIWNNDQPAGAS